MRPSTTQAVRNNAEWCDAVCTARGVPGTFSTHLWVSRGAPPPYYPNIITLAPSSPAVSAALAKAIDSLRSEVSQELSVKDSFGDTDLSGLGFRVLFEARWFGRRGAHSVRRDGGSGLQWIALRSEEDLVAWKNAWDPKILNVDPVFLPSLLDDENMLFIAAKRGGVIIAGAVVNKHAGAVGISNFFSRTTATATCWSECVSIAMARFPGLPVVGYAQGAELSGAVSVGFDELGPLRLWALT